MRLLCSEEGKKGKEEQVGTRTNENGRFDRWLCNSCQPVSLFVCLLICLSVCLPAYLSVCPAATRQLWVTETDLLTEKWVKQSPAETDRKREMKSESRGRKVKREGDSDGLAGAAACKVTGNIAEWKRVRMRVRVRERETG